MKTPRLLPADHPDLATQRMRHAIMHPGIEFACISCKKIISYDSSQEKLKMCLVWASSSTKSNDSACSQFQFP